MPNKAIRNQLDEYYRAVGQRVTKAMEDKQVGDDELAFFCGVQIKHIRRLKRGARGYVHGHLIRLVAQALEMKAADLEGQPPEFA